MPESKTIHVTAGNYAVSEKAPLVYEALLSSCVGVALYDLNKGIGGFGHYLLPEPVSSDRVPDRNKYASTGLPLVLNEMQNLGAEIENIRAVIAGGAFTGRLSQQDIGLDIGGRTAEVVKNILKKNNIRIEDSETGGFFPVRMSFDLSTWDVEISMLDHNSMGQIQREADLAGKKIEAVYSSIKPIPQVALKILRMINEDLGNLEDFSVEVKKDQVISAKVLKFCNTAVFAGKGRIDTIGDALLIIGQDNLARILTSMVVKGLFPGSERGYSMVQGGLYHHSIGVALLAEKIAEKTGKVHSFSAYTAGLLHDIGKVVLDQFVASSQPLFYRECLSLRNQNSTRVEKKHFNTDHTETGRRLAGIWGLPGTITAAINFHHRPEECIEHSEIVFITALANNLFHMFKAGPKLARVDVAALPFLMESLGMDMTDFPSLIDLIPLDILTTDPEAAIV